MRNTAIHRSILILMFIVGAMDGFAQAPYNGLYGTPFDDVPLAVVQNADGGYTMAGNTSWNSSGWYDFNLVRTDANGDTIWSRQYGTSVEDRLYDMKRTADGGYVLAGTTADTNGWELDIYVVRTDSTGQLLWSSVYDYVGQEQPRGVIETTSGSIIVCGTTDSFPVLNRNCGFLLKLNASGQAQWMNRYRLTAFSDSFGEDVIESDSGGYVFAGHGTLYLAASLTTVVVRTDTSGNIIWSETINDAITLRTTEIIETDSGRIILCGTAGVGIYVVQLNAAGAFLRRDFYSSPAYLLEVYDISLAAPNELVIAGKSYDGSMTGGLCMKVSLGGSVIYAHDIDQTHEHYFVSCQTTADGGTLLVGPYPNAHVVGDSASFFLVKTDLQGNGLCGTYNIIAVSGASGVSTVQVGSPDILTGITQHAVVTYVKSGIVPLPLCSNDIHSDEKQNNLQVYPNPVAGTLTVSLPSGRADRIVLTDMSGREILSVENRIGLTCEIDFNSLSPGIYFLSVTQNGIQQTNKVVKE